MKPGTFKLAYVAAVICWGLLSYTQFAEWLSKGELFARAIDNKPYVNDFVNTYSASHLAERCLEHRIDVYDPKIQDAAFRKLVAPVVPEQPFYFQYPPHYFMLVLPLAMFSMPVAWFVWNFIWAVAGIFAFRSLTRGLTRNLSVAITLMAFTSYPWWMSVQLGQTSLLIFPLLVLFFSLLSRNRAIAAGIVAAFMSVKLQYLPALAIMGTLAGGAPFVFALVLGLGALLGTSTLLLGVQNILRFPQALAIGETGQGFTGVNAFAMQNFRGELWLFTHGETPVTRAVCIAMYALSLVALTVIWWRYRKLTEGTDIHSGLSPAATKRFRLTAAVSILLMIAMSLHTHVQDYVFAFISCIWIWRDLLNADSAGGGSSATSGKLAWIRRLVEYYPGLSWLFLFIGMLSSVLFVQPFFFWGVLVFALVISSEQHHRAGGNNQQATAND